MYTLYMDCNEGLQEEMILGSLFDLCLEKKSFLTTMNHLFTFGLLLRAKPYFMNKTQAVRIQILSSDLTPLSFSSTNSAPCYATDFQTVVQSIRALNLPEKVKSNAIEIFHSIQLDQPIGYQHANENPTHMSFFTYPALFFILGICLLIEMIHPEQIIAKLPSNYGKMTAADTPSLGYYFLKHLCNGFTQDLPVKVSGKGIGVSTIDQQDVFAYAYLCNMEVFSSPYTAFANQSVLAAKESQDADSIPANSSSYDTKKDSVLEICCNIDDMTGEQIGYAFDLFLKEGALDVYYTPIYMKKNRPGILFTCLCHPTQQDKFTKLFFKHTTTRGVRYRIYERSVLDSSSVELDTLYGKIHQKNSYNQEIKKSKLEYDDVKKAADLNGVPLLDIYNKVIKEPF